MNSSNLPVANRPAPSLLLGKRAVANFYPERARLEKLDRCGAPRPTQLAPRQDILAVPQSTAPMLLQCSGATSSLPQSAQLCPKDFLTFEGGDRFTVIRGDLSGRATYVTQGLAADRNTACAQAVEALQALWAARSAECDDHLVLLLPASCDPQRSPSAFNRLLARLAKASGAREIFYTTDLVGPPNHANSDRALEAAQKALRTASGMYKTQAVGAYAHEQAKQSGRRGMLELEDKWRAIEMQAAREESSTATQGSCKVFGVEANKNLAQNVADELQGTLGRHSFTGPEPQVHLQSDVGGCDVAIIHSLRPASFNQAPATYLGGPASTFEALLLAQAARDAGAAHVTIVQAYQMNARSDREEHGHNTHAAAYCDLVARWFDAVKCDASVLVECHDVHTPTSWSRPKRSHARTVDGMRLMVEDCLKTLPEAQRPHAAMACPDAGSAKRAKPLRDLFVKTLEGSKERTTHGGDPVLLSLGGGPIAKETVVLLPDDETATGSTLVQTLQALKRQGARTVHALLVHNNLPLDLVQRHLTLALFRYHGATTLRFSDTHAMGPIANSYEALLNLTRGADTAARVRDFIARKGLDVTPTELFSGLAETVKVVSMAKPIATAVASMSKQSVTTTAPQQATSSARMSTDELRALVRAVPNFPKPGILFRDTSRLLLNPNARASVIDRWAERYMNRGITRVVGLESRGFSFAVELADRLNCGYVQFRKPGKTPPPVHHAEYTLEYGSDRLEVDPACLTANDTVLVVDDLLATGGTAAAALHLVEKCGARTEAVVTLIELESLSGRERVGNTPVDSLLKY